MKRTSIELKNWQLITLPNALVKEKNISASTAEELISAGYKAIRASVPGNFELDLMREGILPDLYFGTNILEAQKLENLHLYYFTEFSYETSDATDDFLVFEGIDTAAEIYLDGVMVAFTENMHHSHTIPLKGISAGNHGVLVHILPTVIYARKFELPAMCFGMEYNMDSINVRKAPYMFGWDIMPRIVSGGIWKPVKIIKLPKSRIVDPFTATRRINSDCATLITTFRLETDADFLTDYTVKISGKCKDSVFSRELKIFNAANRVTIDVKHAYLWWPKNYGEQNLYDIEITLYFKGIECDKATYRTGIRTARLNRTSLAGDNGEFCFLINDKKVFCMGTNWVPTDAFPSRHDEYTLRGLELVKECNCNMIRCWGGNTYPDSLFYDYCDENGIMVWQDFSLGCGHYSDSDHLCALVKEEVKQVVKRLRNHPSLVLWAGDNECDCFVAEEFYCDHSDSGTKDWIDPNYNKLTRDVIFREVRNHDATRPYLPSSPYIDSLAFQCGMPSENHLWGPRDYFKGDYYKNPACHFASEIGYHGCPSVQSLKKFLPENSLAERGDGNVCSNTDWLTHATCMEPNPLAPYAYRIPLMIRQVERIFDVADKDLATFVKQSQISQAEADKYFIERFRIDKWRKTGILWWNIIDGWPQISDAVVDWYGCKKLAFYYIQRSQTPFCMMLDEPKDGKMALVATNDTRQSLTVNYTVKNLANGETVDKGSFKIDPDEKIVTNTLPELDNAFYFIEWSTELGKGKNHHACSLGDKWNFNDYARCMKAAGFYEEFSE